MHRQKKRLHELLKRVVTALEVGYDEELEEDIAAFMRELRTEELTAAEVVEEQGLGERGLKDWCPRVAQRTGQGREQKGIEVTLVFRVSGLSLTKIAQLIRGRK